MTTPPQPLSREQVEVMVTSMVQDKIDGINAQRLLDHDAALRAEIEHLGNKYHEAVNAGAVEIDTLKAQLQAVTQEQAAIQQAIAKEFAKKEYTDEDRAHNDLLENIGTFLDHHQELEAKLQAREATMAELKVERDRWYDAAHERILLINDLEATISQLRKVGQFVTFVLEHPDGDYDRPDIIKAEAEQYGLEKLVVMRATIMRLNEAIAECLNADYERRKEIFNEAQHALREGEPHPKEV